MQSLYEAIDYRAYLKAYYEEQKRRTRYFSYRYFARKAGINSSSFLKSVIEGRRNLTPAAAEKFCKALKLPPKEATYFRHLVMFNQARTAVEKQEHYAVLRSMAGGVNEAVVKSPCYDYYSTWYNSILRELVCLFDFGDDFAALARAVRPSITETQARRSVDLLLRLRLIRKTDNGRYEQTDTAIIADETIGALGLRSFIGWMARYTETALNEYSRDERYVSSVTMGVSRATYDMLVAEIEAFKDRLKTIVNQDRDSSRVYQLNLGLFPMSVDTADIPAEREEQQ